MTRTSSYIAPLLAAAALMGCDNSGNTVVLGPDGQEVNQAQQEAVQNVQLPPSIVASHQYRCRDNSLISIDWLSDGTTNGARVKAEGGEAVTVSQAEAGGDYTAEGATLNGGPEAQSVTWNGKTCNR